MLIFRHLFLILLVFSNAHAGHRDQQYYRTFWNPCYQGSRLAYCLADDKECGLPVAHRYCQLKGYEKAVKQAIDYNVRQSQAFLSRKPCKGLQCNGFTLIRCKAKLTHQPVSSYYYRSQAFVRPRFDHARVDWCYEDGKGCGQRAAQSFCRRMGYVRQQSYKIENHVCETKALGNHKLCVGDDCRAFKRIVCYR